MSLRMVPCGPDRYGEWDRFREEHPACPLFHSRPWLNLLARHQDARLDMYLMEDTRGVAGIFPVFSRNYVVLRVFSSPYVVTDTPYLGPLVRADVPCGDLWSTLLAHARSGGMDFLRMFTRVGVPLPDIEPGVASVQRKTTHVLDLALGEDAIWEGMEGRCRTAVRKALKDGVTVGEAVGDGFIDRYVDMLEGVYARQGLASPNARPFYREMWSLFGGREIIGLMAVHEGRDIAGALFVMDPHDAYYISGASVADAGRVSPNNILQWEAIRLAMARGVDRYDFVGSDIPRIAKFKQSFGGMLHEYWCIEAAPSRLARLMREAYPWLKRRLGRV